MMLSRRRVVREVIILFEFLYDSFENNREKPTDDEKKYAVAQQNEKNTKTNERKKR